MSLLIAIARKALPRLALGCTDIVRRRLAFAEKKCAHRGAFGRCAGFCSDPDRCRQGADVPYLLRARVLLTSRPAPRWLRNNRLSGDYNLTVSSSVRGSSCVSLLVSVAVNATSSCDLASATSATGLHIASGFAGGTSCGTSTGLMDNQRRNRIAV